MGRDRERVRHQKPAHSLRLNRVQLRATPRIQTIWRCWEIVLKFGGPENLNAARILLEFNPGVIVWRHVWKIGSRQIRRCRHPSVGIKDKSPCASEKEEEEARKLVTQPAVVGQAGGGDRSLLLAS